jgi:hypothetical protein
MDNHAVDQEFEKIVINEELAIINRNLGHASVSAKFAGADSLKFLDQFIDPERGLPPDIDADFVDPFRGVFLNIS